MGLTGFNLRRREIARPAAIASKETSAEHEKSATKPAKKLNQMNKAELLAYAASIGLEFDTKTTNENIKAAIQEHEAKLDEQCGNDNNGDAGDGASGNEAGSKDGEASD